MNYICVLIGVLSIIFAYLALIETSRGLYPSQYTASPLFQLRTFLFQDRLKQAQLIRMPGPGPEDIQIDSRGFIYTGLFQGGLYKINPVTKEIQKIAQSQGRVLGLSLNPYWEDKLAFIDLKAGIGILDLFSFSIKYYARQFKNQSINSLTFTSENTLYFTVTGTIPMQNFHEQVLYKTSEGSVHCLNLLTNKTSVFLEGLSFPNGIDYHSKSKYLYINQLNNYRILKVHIPQESQEQIKTEVVLDNLIGFPDNIKVIEDGTLWVGMPELRNYMIDLIDHSPIIRKILLNVGISAYNFAMLGRLDYVGGMRVSQDGQIIQYLQGKWDQIKFVTTINQKGDMIVLGSSRNIFMAIINATKIKQNHYKNSF